jgi:hypothetical protein
MTDRINLADDMRRRAGMGPDDIEQVPAAGTSLSAAEREVVVAERQRAILIIAACSVAGRQDLASDLIAGGAPLGDVLRTLGRAKPTPRGTGRA